MIKHRLLIYVAGALALLLCAGCGWSSGKPFAGDYADFDPEAYDPTDASPVSAVQAWFSSMEFVRSENEKGVKVPDREKGRDFDLWLCVVDPKVLKDSNGQFIGMPQVEELREIWNDTDSWEVEFLGVKMEPGSEEKEEARVDLVGGDIRYIGSDFFDSPEYRQDSFGDKKGRVFLREYEDAENDPLQHIPGFEDIAGKRRWVIVGGLDLSEDKAWGGEPGS